MPVDVPGGHVIELRRNCIALYDVVAASKSMIAGSANGRLEGLMHCQHPQVSPDVGPTSLG
jgi:hypothetical protein